MSNVATPGICVGVGKRGRAWIKWARAAGMQIRGVVDLNRTLLDQVCDELGIPANQRFTSIGQAAAATDAKIATVCTANAAHLVCIRQCLDAGLHVLVEKPMVQEPGEARAVLEHAARVNRHVAVAQNYRYDPMTLAARKAVADGLVGEVHTVRLWFSRWRPAPGMRLPLLLNQGIHHFDAARWILGCDPAWCFARVDNPSWSPSDEATIMEAIWGFADASREVLFSYGGNYISQGTPLPYSGQWTIEGSEGRLCWPVNDAVMLSQRQQAEQALDAPAPELPGPAEVLRQTLAALDADRVPPTDAGDNIRSLSMCWDAVRSSDCRQVVKAMSAYETASAPAR